MTYRTRYSDLFDKATAIAHEAAVLKPSPGRLPPLFFVTDPARTPRPEDIAALLPQGCGLIYRHFGEEQALPRARLLRKIADERGLTLLIGEDDRLAIAVGADGVHLSQKSLGRLKEVHAAHPQLKLSLACHDLETLARLPGDAPVSAIFVSPIFASRSASAIGKPSLGVQGAREFSAATTLPVYGLGGVTLGNIDELRGSGLSGIGAVDAFAIADNQGIRT